MTAYSTQHHSPAGTRFDFHLPVIITPVAEIPLAATYQRRARQERVKRVRQGMLDQLHESCVHSRSVYLINSGEQGHRI